MVMKHKVKRVIGLLLIAVLMSSVATGCGKTTLTNTVQNENKQKDSDAWMEDDASGQKDTDKSETSKEEEYYDVDKIQGGEVDYSKYEEKKSIQSSKRKIATAMLHTAMGPEVDRINIRQILFRKECKIRWNQEKSQLTKARNRPAISPFPVQRFLTIWKI